ncbi:hypothetical protein A7U43_00485 [Mycobacterium adipatum]|uniref:HTH tetR-type domain-containing protein n=1 Tax=Mycobacterium adipatum TaxID=1682113 RepID=A0A172UFR6_9MYCO|nr:helix-turn-helix domain-containing protein [Mycobacterium adipatum]ANE78003.1 hypothetical protein A7U43_00485 [Mycobacterium adipatum]MBI5736976.1 TetR/AcrR family transcriptional regulator [Mycolicibacterium neoaurum]
MVESDRDTRQRMVAGAADMLGRAGFSALTVRELARHAAAPLGSTYHYFPGGKSQLAAEAIRWVDARMTAQLQDAAAGGAVALVDRLLNLWREALVDSDFQCGCAVLAVAVQVGEDDVAPRDAAVFAFSNWTSAVAGALRDDGARHADAADTAMLVVAAVEGAVAMCRAERSTDPLDAVGRRLHAMLAAFRA